MGQADIALRHIARRRPEELVRGVLPPGLSFEVMDWFDGQVTALERRLDKAIWLRFGEALRLLHVEIEIGLDATDLFRIWDYHGLLVRAVHLDPRTPKPAGISEDTGRLMLRTPVPVLSVVIMLRGRRRAWPVEGAYATGWPELPESGVQLRIEAVYQRRVAELRARQSLFWLVFTPLCTDADAAAMREVLAEVSERARDLQERAELFAGLLVMAEIDPWGHNLKQEITTMIQTDWSEYAELLALSPTLREAFEEGEQKGEEKGVLKGRLDMLRAVFAEQAGREPSADEQAALAKRARELGAEQAVRAVLKLHGDGLASWLLASAS